MLLFNKLGWFKDYSWFDLIGLFHENNVITHD